MYVAPQLPPVCKGVCMRKRDGRWWVSVPVAAESVPEEVCAGRGGVLHGPAPGRAASVCGLWQGVDMKPRASARGILLLFCFCVFIIT